MTRIKVVVPDLKRTGIFTLIRHVSDQSDV